jgi:hypothetical protein
VYYTDQPRRKEREECRCGQREREGRRERERQRETERKREEASACQHLFEWTILQNILNLSKITNDFFLVFRTST